MIVFNNLKLIQKLLSQKDKKKFFLLLFSIIMMSILDTIGIASIMPFIAVLANPGLIETNSFLIELYNLSKQLGVSEIKEFNFLLGVIFFTLLITSLLIRAFTTYMMINYSLILEYSVSKRLFEAYLHQPYSWFLDRHSADLSKNMLSEVNLTINNSVSPILTIISQTIGVMLILFLLVVVDPMLSLIISSIFISSYFIIYFFFKNILSKIGSARYVANTKRFNVVTEAFGAIKELKLAGLEKYYFTRFKKPAEIFAKNQAIAKTLSSLPRYFIEGVAFGGMVLLILFLLKNSNNFSEILPILAVYTFAGYRIIPSIQQIYSSLTQLRFSGPAIENLVNEYINLKYIKPKQINKFDKLNLKESIVLNSLSFSYPNSEKASLNSVNIKIEAFKKVAIVGLTGSGKTTIIDLILGLLEPKQGTIEVDGIIICPDNKKIWQSKIGYVPQQIYLSDDTIEKNIAFGIDEVDVDHARVEKVAKVANLHEFVINNLPKKYETYIGERGIRLSGGQKQRIGIARALYHKPDVLILDEATSALDNLTENAVMQAIKNLNKDLTIILISHRLSIVKGFDKIFLINEGKVVASGTFELLEKNNNFFRELINASN